MYINNNNNCTFLAECPLPPSVENRETKVMSTQVGDIVRYNCKSGTVLIGDVVSQCQTNGRWSGNSPTCKSK